MVQYKKDKRHKKPATHGGRTLAPLVSVVMPVRNGEKTVAGAINSILSQTYENWELIIVDDGSTDNTYQEIKKFEDKRIRYFIREYAGIPATRNYGNKMAKGSYCIVQDADDYSLPDRLEKVVKAFIKTKADIVIHSVYVNAWNEQYECLERKYLQAERADEERIKISQYLPGLPAYRKGVWAAKPFREETRYAYDWMMWVDWILSGFTVTVLDEALYEYVRYQGSASDRFERSGERAKAFEIIRKIINDEYET